MRRTSLILGLLALGGAWFTNLPSIAREAFWAHMTMHMIVVAVAAPLVALGIAGTRFDPVSKFPRLLTPIPASVVELVVVWAWHAPVLHHIARNSAAGLFAEQGSFLLTGLAVWLSAFGGPPAHKASRRAAGVIGLLLTSMHMTLLGALIALAPRPLYEHHGEEATHLASLDDQHLGGAIMLLVGGIAYMAGGLWLTIGLLRAAARERGNAC